MSGGLRDHLLVLGRFLRNPRQTGTIAPSSRALALEMVKGLDLAHAANVVELGPGTGAFTEAIVANLGPRTRLLVVEIEPEFAAEIRRRWPSVDCVCASATELDTLVDARGMRPVDHIVSGLPFASLPGAVTRDILAAIERSLKPGGTFTTFQYVHAFRLPPAVAFRRDINARLGGEPTRSLVAWNIPPAWVLTWRTRSS